MAITPLIQEYIVDFASNNNFFFVNAVQGDGHGVRYVKLALTNNGQPYYIPVDGSAAIIIRGTTPNGDQYLDTETGEITDSSTIQFELRQSMILYAGKGKFEVCVVNKESNQLLTSFPFYVCISESGFDTQSITGDENTTFIDLVDTLSKVTTSLKKCEDTIAETNRILELAEKSFELSKDVDAQGNLAEEKGNKAEEKGIYAYQWAEAARLAVEDIQDKMAINDNKISKTTSWSSYKVNEELSNHLNGHPFLCVEGSVAVYNINEVTTSENNGDIKMFSSHFNIVDSSDGISVSSGDIVVKDDDVGNLTIMTM